MKDPPAGGVLRGKSRGKSRGSSAGGAGPGFGSLARRVLRPGGWGAALLGLAVGLGSGRAEAVSSERARARASSALASVESEARSLRRVAAETVRIDPSRLVTAAELHFRTKDYQPAIDQLNKVLELERQGRVSDSVAADAAFLLAEAYFASDQLYSAGRYYEQIVERADRRAYAPFAGRAASRLVDVALRTRRAETLDAVLAKLDALALPDDTGALRFARAKALFAKGDVRGAREVAARVPVGSEYAHRAGYLIGVTLLKEVRPASGGTTVSPPGAGADLSLAIQAFQRVTTLAAESPEQKHVVDLAWMAIGRLHYERGAYLNAADAYAQVPRTSPEFTTALYELAWTYVRLGDYDRGQRALDLLSVLDPTRIDAADGALLRADLLLRSGKFEPALAAYQAARDEYDPLHRQVAVFLRSHSDPADYYDVLTADSIEATGELSTVALEWAREEAGDERMFAVTDDIARSRDLVKRSRLLIARLEAVLNSPSRAKLFPELQAELEGALSLVNRVALARRQLALGLDEEAGSNVRGELSQVRRERRGLMKRLGVVPAYPTDFNRRRSQAEREWNRVSQTLQRLTLHTDHLGAMLNGLRRVLHDAERYEATRSPAARARFQEELRKGERELAEHRRRIERLSLSAELGRVRVGLGDERFREDEVVRRRFRELFAREVALTAAGGDASDAVAYARAIQPLLRRADGLDDVVEKVRAALQAAADERSQELMALVAREKERMKEYSARLEDLDQNARLLLGQVAMHNLELVRQRLKRVVQRADVGIVQHAWELREEQIYRVRQLQRERAREERYLDDELREVLDEAEDLP